MTRTSPTTTPAATPATGTAAGDRVDLCFWLPELITAGVLLLIGALLWWPALWLGLAALVWVAIRVGWRRACNRLVAAQDAAARATARRLCPCGELPALECATGDGDDCLPPESGTSEVCDITGEETTE